jgi:RNA polymerase sigma-70 factor (ECF subfamily)
MAKIDFAEVYADCQKKVWQLVFRYVSTREDREDLFQEIFLKVHQALPRFRGEAEISTWVYRIAVNTALNYLNKQKRYRWLKQVVGNWRAVPAAEPSEPAEAELFKPLAKLNAQQRMIVLLADVEEKKLDEIAEMLKLPVGTVKSNLHRAREIIKKEVKANGGV